MSQVRGRRPEAGSRKPEVGSRKPEAGSRKPEAGSRKPEAGSRKPEAGSRKPEAGSRKPEAGLFATELRAMARLGSDGDRDVSTLKEGLWDVRRHLMGRLVWRLGRMRVERTRL